MTGQVNELAAAGVKWMMKLGGKGRKRISRIVRERRPRIEFGMFQVGGAITVPQTLQVRWAALE